MGKDEHDKPPVTDAIKVAVGQLRLPLAGLLCLLALLLAWDGWRQGVSSRAQSTVASEGARLQGAEKTYLTDLITSFDHAAAAPEVVTAAGEGDFAQAARDFQKRWADGKSVQFVQPDLGSAFSDPAKFGFGRVAVLTATLRDGVTRAGVARVDGQPRLVIAGAIRQGSEVKALALVDLPIDELKNPIESASTGGGFVSLQFHGYVVASRGDATAVVLGKSDRLAVRDGGFEIVTGSPPQVEGML
ncbi:MAG: hypothetical protein JSS03_08980, partial [Proteobacteria bacterium]|nr:hypothetical protein [Pseudomonadota bacterium]